MGGWRNAATAASVGACFFAHLESATAQVVAEPALLTAGIPVSETFTPYVAIPEHALVLGGMLRFPVSEDVDIGGRAGLWLIDDRDDTPFVGVDARYGLLLRPLTPGGGQLALSFDVGIGVSDPGPTVWRIPLGFIAGIGFSLAGGDSEIFAHPRFDLGISSGEDDFDPGLLLDVGGVFSITPLLGAIIDFRFGEGPFDDSERVVVALGGIWRL